MIIRSLKLANYRRFKTLDLEFPENIIGIIGRNGAGKSTLIEAIGWVLYGNRFVRTDKMDVRSMHAEAKQSCRAELLFSVGGAEYRIVRSLKGKNAVSEAAVYRDGKSEPEAVQDRGVNEFVESLLQLDFRSFTSSVFAQQKELAKLTSLQPEQRRQAINRLINIDRIDLAREKVRRDRNEKQAFVAGKKSALRDADELQAQKKTLVDQEKSIKKQVTTLGKELNERGKEDTAAREQFEAASKLRDQFLNLEAQIGKLQSRCEENEKSLRQAEIELQDIKAAGVELKALSVQMKDFDQLVQEKEALDNLREKNVKLTSRRNELELVQSAIKRESDKLKSAQAEAAALKTLELEAAQWLEKEESLEQQRTRLEQQIKETHGLKVTAESRGKEIKEKLQRIEDLGPDGECPVCTQRLDEHYGGVVADHQQQLAALREEYRNHQQAEAQLTRQKKEIEAALFAARREKEKAAKKMQRAQQAEELAQQITDHLVDYDSQEKLIMAAMAELGRVEYDEEKHAQVKAKYQELLKLQQHKAKLEERVGRKTEVESQHSLLKKNIADMTGDMQSKKAEQAGLGFSQQDYEKLKSAVEDRQSALTAARDKRAAAEQALAVLQRDMANVDKELLEQQKIQREIETTEEDILYLNALDEHLGRFRLELAGRVRPLIAQRASELLALTTLSRYSQIDLDQDYNISIYDGTTAFPVHRFSGGEQDLANLCLRIAISQVVAERAGGSPVNFIVLDEIFGSQDNERRELILNALGQLSSQFRQVFVITHIEAIKDVLPVLVQVEEKDENYSVALLS